MNEPSQQIDATLNVCIAPDQPLKCKNLRNAFLSVARKNPDWEVGCDTFGNNAIMSIDLPNGEKHRFCLAAVTFLGGDGNHPIFKKRIQLKRWFKEAYAHLSSQNCIVHFSGIYHYEQNLIFVDFLPETYIKRKMHNSSAFVYINDLFRAMQDGIAYRTDLHGNTIITVRANAFADYLQTHTKISCSSNDELIKVFMDFNRNFPFDQWLPGGETIDKMRIAQWPKWRETEWPGWYLEFEFCSFLHQNGINNILYKGSPKINTCWELDFDLFFPKHKFYGDLKASDCNKKDAPGNDREAIAAAISRYGRLWYIIYEHDTVKDSDCGGEVCRFRFYLPDSRATSITSYITRMKNRVNFRKMMILELNRANCDLILKDFNQGKQPDGSQRTPKKIINKRNVENFQILYYSVNEN